MPGDEPAALEAALASAVERARSAWPRLAIDDPALVEALAERMPGKGPAVEALEQICVEDLALARACAAGDEVALELFERELIPGLRAALLARHEAAEAVEETLQRLRQRLFVGERGPGKIAEYSGRGPLATWARMAAIRLALNLRREARRDVPFEEAPEASLSLPAPPPELGVIKARYRGDFKACFEAAFAALEPRMRTVLKLQLIDGLSTAQIGRIYRVDASTVRRWLIEARGSLLEGTRKGLAERLGLHDSELESMVALLVTQLDQSVRRIFAEHSPER